MEPQMHIHRTENECKDSLSIGSSAKNCEIKIYCDFSDVEATEQKIIKALAARKSLMDKVGVTL